jgi:hypothetical protein
MKDTMQFKEKSTVKNVNLNVVLVKVNTYVSPVLILPYNPPSVKVLQEDSSLLIQTTEL